jgi:hypothetical protein
LLVGCGARGRAKIELDPSLCDYMTSVGAQASAGPARLPARLLVVRDQAPAGDRNWSAAVSKKGLRRGLPRICPALPVLARRRRRSGTTMAEGEARIAFYCATGLRDYNKKKKIKKKKIEKSESAY